MAVPTEATRTWDSTGARPAGIAVSNLDRAPGLACDPLGRERVRCRLFHSHVLEFQESPPNVPN